MISATNYCRIASILALAAIGADALSVEYKGYRCKGSTFTLEDVVLMCGKEGGEKTQNVCTFGDQVVLTANVEILQEVPAALQTTPNACWNTCTWWGYCSRVVCQEFETVSTDNVCNTLGINGDCTKVGTYSVSLTETIPQYDVSSAASKLGTGKNVTVDLVISDGSTDLETCTIEFETTADISVAGGLIAVAAVILAGAGYYAKKRRSAAAIPSLDSSDFIEKGSTNFIQMTDRKNAAVV